MSLDYLVKLSVHILQVNSGWNCEPETHQMFLSRRLQNQADYDKMLYLLS